MKEWQGCFFDLGEYEYPPPDASSVEQELWITLDYCLDSECMKTRYCVERLGELILKVIDEEKY